MISWSAKRQETVSRSSTEAEYQALAETAQEITWISQLLRDLDIPQERSTLLLCDNLSAVYLSTNPALHKKSKHFERDWHYIRERVALGLIETRHIPASLQIADIFTKALPRQAFEHLRRKLGVEETPTPSLRGNVSDKAQSTAKTTSKISAQNNTEVLLLQRSPFPLLSCSRTEQGGTAPHPVSTYNAFDPLLSCSAGG